MVIRNFTFKSEATLKKQLLSFFIASVFILSFATSLVTAWQTSREVKASTLEDGLQMTSNFAEQAILALLTGSEENAQEAVDRALAFKSVMSVSILDAEAKLLVTNSKKDQNAVDVKLDQALESPILHSEFSDVWVFAAPVMFADEELDSAFIEPSTEVKSQFLGSVLVEYDKTPLFQIQNTIFINNLSIGIFIAIVLALIMAWGINRLVQPLTTLSDTMKSSGDSADYLQAKVDGALEIRQMAETYNQMMERLAQQRTELEKHRATLKSEVDVRTQELKVARDSALTASRHKSEFLANISHELRTPLQAIIGYTDLVREDLEMECMDPQAEDLGKAIRSAHVLLGLINNILDLAKIEAGKMDLYIQPVDMEYLINDAVETITPMATANGNKVEVKTGNMSDSLDLDRQKMLQIFLNLLSNACKFTKNGLITFEIENDSRQLLFSITDTGIGIPQEKLKFIFEQFTQVDGGQSRKFEGTGLGMAITQSFCHMMGAEINVESKEGEGTCFKVAIPLRTSDMPVESQV